jgi:hypothetical protein
MLDDMFAGVYAAIAALLTYGALAPYLPPWLAL